MCLSYKEISLRSVCLPQSLCFGTRVCLNVVETTNPRVQFLADITSDLLLIVAVHKLASWLLRIVMRISK